MKVLTVLMVVLAMGESLSLAFLLKSLALSHSKGGSSHHKGSKAEDDHHSEASSGHGKQFAIRIAGEHVKSVLIKISGDDVKLARTKDGYTIGIGNEKPKASIKIELPDEDLHSLPYPPPKDYSDDEIPHHFPGPYKIHEDVHEEHDDDGPPKKPVFHVHREPAHHDAPPDSEHHFPPYFYNYKSSKHHSKRPDHVFYGHKETAHHDAPPDSHKEEHPFPPYDYHHKDTEHSPKEPPSHKSVPNLESFESFLKLWHSLQYPAEKRIGGPTENGTSTTPSPPPQKRQTRQRRLY